MNRSSAQKVEHAEQSLEAGVLRAQKGRPCILRRPGLDRFTLARQMRFGTQLALAEALTREGVPTLGASVGDWERGRCQPSEQAIAVLAQLLGVRVDAVEAWFCGASVAQLARSVTPYPVSGVTHERA